LVASELPDENASALLTGQTLLPSGGGSPLGVIDFFLMISL